MEHGAVDPRDFEPRLGVAHRANGLTQVYPSYPVGIRVRVSVRHGTRFRIRVRVSVHTPSP